MSWIFRKKYLNELNQVVSLGKVTYANGHTCEGEWLDGERNGWLIYAYPRQTEKVKGYNVVCPLQHIYHPCLNRTVSTVNT